MTMRVFVSPDNRKELFDCSETLACCLCPQWSSETRLWKREIFTNAEIVISEQTVGN